MAIDYDKRAKGQSKREYEAQIKGGQLNYKSGKITVPQKVIAPVQKKVVYSPSAGTAKVVTPQSTSSSQNMSSNKNNAFNPQNPFAKFSTPSPFKLQNQAVQNYSSKYNQQETEEEKRKRESAAQDKQITDDVKKNTGWKNIVKNTVKGLPSAAKKVGSFLGGVGKSVARSPITIPTKTLLTLTGQKQLAEGGKVQKFLVGDEPVTSYTKDSEDYGKWAQSKGLKGNKGMLAGAGLAAGSIFLDLGTGGSGKGAKEVGKGVVKQVIKQGAEKAAKTAGKSVFKSAAEGISSAASRAVSAAVKAGRSKDEIMAIVKADAKKTFEGVGKNVVQDSQIRAAGNTVIGNKVAGAGRSVGDVFKTPRAVASEFAPESTAFRTVAKDTEAGVKVSRGTQAADDAMNVKRFSQDKPKTSGSARQIEEAVQTPPKSAIERTKVARLNERTAALRAKVAQAIEDSKKAADDGVTLDKDPFDDIDAEVNSFKKEFESLTGEKAPKDPDELIARIRSIEGENKGAWLKEDRNITRRKELASMGGVRRLPGYARGTKAARGGKGRSGVKFAGKKGVFTEARTKQLIKQDNENYKKSLLASISQRQADIKDELAREARKPKLDLDKMDALRTEMEQDLPLMHKDIRGGKVSEEDLYEMGKGFAQKGRDPFKIQFQGEKNGILPVANNNQYNSLPLKKGDGAIRQIATAEVSGAKQASAVIDGGGNVPRGTTPAVSEIPPMPKQGAVKSWVDKVGTNMREVIQDNWIRVKKLQENPNAKIDTSKLTPYEAETLFHGRVGHRLSTATDTLKTIDKTIADAEKALKRPELRKDIDKYLVAKHAPERNALHGDGAAGMTTKEADDIVKAFEGDKANEGAMKIAQDIKKTNEQTLDILHDSQVIDDETFKTLRETYKNHIPLNRVMGDTDDIGGALVGKGYDVKSSGIKRAKGSDKEVADILTNVGANLEQAIVRAEKNRVNLATLNFARENKHLGMFEEINPKILGKQIDFGAREPGMKLADVPTKDKYIFEQITDPLVLTVRENGKPVYLRIKDEKLAQAFKGIGNEKLPPVLSFISGFTRMYSGLATRFNPEFAFSNKLRDLQEMSIYMSSQKGIGFSGAGKTVTRDIFSIKDVVDFKRGGNSEGAKLYKQMMEDGGTTGGQALSTRKQLEIDLDAIRKLNRGGKFNMRANGKKIIDAFDSWNEVFEDSTRLSTYKTALDKGMSREQAAIIAKNATLNFNKKGTGGPVINGMYMFANASIQGSTKLLKSMKDPKTAAAVVTAVTASVAATNSWNDSVDPEWRKKVSEWDRNSNLVVMLPGGGAGAKYMTIPVSWGIKPIKVMADYGMDALAGKADQNTGLDVAGKVMSSLWNAYNPVGGTDLTSAAVPSFLDIPVEVARNQKWSGSAMRPDAKEGVPASEAFFQNKEGVPSDKSKIFGVLRQGTKFLADKSGGQIEINPANLKYALDGYLSGLGKFGTGIAETGIAAKKGELPQASDTPFTRRFYKTQTEEQVTKNQSYTEKDDLYANLKKLPKDQQSPAIQEYLNSLPAEKRKGAAYGLMMEGFNTKGTTSSDDVIRMKPLVDKINEMEENGDYDEVDKIIEGLSEEDLKSYKNAAKSVKAKATKETKEALKPKLDPIVDKIIELEDGGKYDESDALFYGLSEDEQKVVQSLIKSR